MTAVKSSTSKKTKQDDGCRKVLVEYLDRTGDALEEQLELCREASKKIAEGSYTAADAQQDWQTSADRAASYTRHATRLWFEGITRCAWTPPFWPPGLFCADASDRE